MRRRLMTILDPVCQIIEADGTMHNFYSYEDAQDYAFATSSSDQLSIYCIKDDIPDHFLYASSTSITPCTWTSITIGKEVTNIGNYAFCTINYSGTGLTVQGTNADIGHYAFQNITIGGTLTIGDGIKEINNMAFYGTSVTSVILSSTVSYLGSMTFTTLPSMPSSLSFYGTSDISYNAAALSLTGITSVRVPTNYSGSTFCGVTVSKVL